MENLRGDNTERYAWLIGGDIASLAAAVFMIRDIHMKGENIHIYERYELDKNSPKEKNQTELADPEEITIDYKQFPSLMNLWTELSVNPDTSLSNMLQFLRNWLKEQGVLFEKITYMADLELTNYADTEEQVVKAIRYITDGKEYTQETGFEDMVIITGGYIAQVMELNLPRHIPTDPLEIRPPGYHNLAFAGHLTENKKAGHSKIQASIKSAQKAVSELSGLK